MTDITLGSALAAAAARLREADLPTPRLDAELLLSHVLGWDRARLYAALPDPLPAGAAAPFAALLAHRLAGEPVAYLVGRREFMGRDFVVGPGVLVPRPETECLVEWLIARARGRPGGARRLRAVDVGTGSGAIALSLAHALPDARVVAVDHSAAALAYAVENRRRQGLTGRVALVRGDLLAPVGKVDIVAANLPYLHPGQLHAGLAHEPLEALLASPPDAAGPADPDGLDLYRALLPQAVTLLAVPGLLAAEIDPSQASAMLALCRATFPRAAVGVERDLAGLERFVTVVQ